MKYCNYKWASRNFLFSFKNKLFCRNYFEIISLEVNFKILNIYRIMSKWSVFIYIRIDIPYFGKIR